MKSIKLIIIFLFAINSVYCQFNHIGSFIEANQSASLELFGSSDLYIPKSGDFVYAFSDSYILKYNIDSITGGPVSVDKFSDNIYGINTTNNCSRSIASTTDDTFLYVAANCQKAFSIFQVDPIAGNCIFVDTVINNRNGITGINSPISLTVSLDNEYLYVASLDNIITTFKIDKNSGNVSFVGSETDPSLEGVDFIKVTPDNKFIYAASYSKSTLFILKRDIGTGLLTLHEKMERDADNELLFNGIRDIEFDKSGFAYIAASNDQSLIVFQKEGDYGKLIKYKKFKDGVDGVSGLTRPIAVECSPDQKFVFVVSRNFLINNSMAAFKWNCSQNLNFADGKVFTPFYSRGMLYSPSNFKISPDSKFLYVSEYRNTICEFYKPGAFLSLGDDIDLCVGDTAFIIPDDCYENYKWSDSSIGNSLTVTSTGSFSLNVVDKLGRIGNDTVSINFHKYPILELGNDTTLFHGDTLRLSVTEGLASYNWSTGETTFEISFVAATAARDTIVTIIATSKYGCSSTDTIALKIESPTSITNVKDFNISIYPNPFENVINVTGEDLLRFETIELIDFSGKVVYKNKINHVNQLEIIPVSNLINSVYLLKLSNKFEFLIRKVIKKPL
jgi:6-phosphogluconolactonase (cycloisomerase 2 family)